MSLLHMKIIKKENKRKTRLMLNIEKYKDIVLENLDACSIDAQLRRKFINVYCKGFNCEGCRERVLKWLLEETKEPVLDDVEREYLSAVIKPFRNHVTSVRKWFNGIDYQIIISLDNADNLCQLPRFPLSSEMYMGMDSNKWYSLQEVGL